MSEPHATSWAGTPSSAELLQHFNENDEPCDVEEWTRAWKVRWSKREYIGNVLLSTVWIGSNSGGRYPPMIYESMAFFDGSHFGTETVEIQYSTRKQAKAGHWYLRTAIYHTKVLRNGVWMDAYDEFAERFR